MSDAPVLFIIFNRPDTAARVFEAIRQARPARLYVAADGPRDGKEGERELCERTRAIIDGVDWPCEVHKRFLDRNLGCKEAVSSAITWFFENEEEGIVLEDDCLPDPSFFPYCQELLGRYRDEPRVMMITGTNYLFGQEAENSYFFSSYFAIWGWASWRRAWSRYDKNMNDWPELKGGRLLRELFGREGSTLVRESFERAYNGKVNTWDAQWFYTGIRAGGLCATPSRNLISNIGATGTHSGTRKSMFVEMPTAPLSFPLRHPGSVERDRDADGKSMKNILKGSGYGLPRLIWKVYGPIKRKVAGRA